MRVSIIAAVATNRVIGKDNALPWRLPADLARFKRLTLGHHVVMGRRTFESIGRPLPGRTTVVLTRNEAYEPGGVRVAASLDEALDTAAGAGDDEAFVAGGAEVYRRALDRADRMYLTVVHGRVEGDAFFPEYDASAWAIVGREEHETDDRNPFRLSFVTYDRRGGPS
jgi:dihydrofolate reductase